MISISVAPAVSGDRGSPVSNRRKITMISSDVRTPVPHTSVEEIWESLPLRPCFPVLETSILFLLLA